MLDTIRKLAGGTVAATGMALAMAAGPAHALTVTVTNDATSLVSALLAPASGLTVVGGSETLLVGAADQQGTYSGFNLSSTEPGMPTLSMPNGVVLTTGTANFSTVENTTNSFSVDSGTGAYAPLVDLAVSGGLNTNQFNSNVLTFEFTVDDPTMNAVFAQFLFATDEFPTQSVTDIMGIFINGANVAFFPNGDLVSNQSGDPNDFFNNNPVGAAGYPIEWNGLTDVFTVAGLVNPGVNTFTIAIADTSDTIFDSALFFGGLKAGVTTGGGGIQVSEPAPLALFGLGVAVLAFVRRRRSV